MASLLTACNKAEIRMPFSDFPKEFDEYKFDLFQHDSSTVGFASELAAFEGDYTEKYTLENAAAGLLIDVNNQEVLFAQNAFEKRPPASITKIMTAYLALEKCTLDEIIVCGQEPVNIADPTATRLGLKLGDSMTMDQALNLCLIPSSNDVAIDIACHISGTEADFAELMTREAHKLGCTSTNFTDSCGLGSEEHYTTCYDLYLIFKEAIKNQDLIDIIQKREYQTTYFDKNQNAVPVSVSSTNWYFRGNATAPDSITVVGAKTGTTTEAGNCLLLLAKDKYSNPYIGIILGADRRDNLYIQMTDLLSQIMN